MVERKKGRLKTNTSHHFEASCLNVEDFNILIVEDSLNNINAMSFMNKIIKQNTIVTWEHQQRADIKKNEYKKILPQFLNRFPQEIFTKIKKNRIFKIMDTLFY